MILVADFPRVAVEGAELPIREVDDLVGKAREGVGVAGEVSAAIAHADDERASEPRSDDEPRFVPRHRGNAVRAFHQAQCLPHRRDEVAIVEPAHELSENFGIGIRTEVDAGRLQLLLERGEVLDHAVMNDGDVVGGIQMRMGVAIGGTAVRGPTRVADAVATRRGVRRDVLAQFDEPTGFLPQVQFVARAGDEPGTIVAAILQSPQAFEQDGRCFPLAGKSHDPAHDSAPSARPKLGERL